MRQCEQIAVPGGRGIDDPMTITVIGEPGAIHGIRKEWLDIEARSANPMTYFQSYDWCEKWVRIYGPDVFRRGGKLHIVLIRKGERLVALLPLVIEKRRGIVRVLRFLGEPLLQYGMVLKDQSMIQPHELKACIEKIIAGAGCDAIYLDHLLEGSPLHRSLREGFTPGLAGHASIVSLERFENGAAYTASLSRQRRKSRNRKRRKLQELGHLETRIIEGDDPAFSRIIDRATEQKATWLRETGLPEARIRDERVVRLLRELGGNSHGSSGAMAFVLELDGRPLAIEVGFWRHRHYYSYLGSFDWEMREYSPGKLLLEDAICWSIDNGFESYDLLGHPSDYKDSIANLTTPITAYARPKTWLGSAYARLWKPHVKPTVKMGIKALPAHYRQQLFRLAAPLMGR